MPEEAYLDKAAMLRNCAATVSCYLFIHVFQTRWNRLSSWDRETQTCDRQQRVRPATTLLVISCCSDHTHSLIDIVVWVLTKDDNLDIIKGTCVERPACTATHAVNLYLHHCQRDVNTQDAETVVPECL